ncbi:importin subunit alpha-8 [Anaeramoeba flamelloides]|uniref:Importin subunit alpha-8 n=1 Tax=Anaeramoeba flamelloides TaxID=1746091 RepID=A0ABQ8YMV7_9EUKA|nr:importin subunit alpha-8 [Anaeramoeba flamelloides]
MSFEKKLEKRKKRFKNKPTVQDSKIKRINLVFSISKKKKDDLLQKKRNIKISNSEESQKTVEEILKTLPEISKQLSDPNCTNKLELVKDLRMMVSGQEDPPFDEIIKSGCVEDIVDFLEEDNNPELQFETAWVLSNISSGNSEQTKYIVELDVISKFIRLLSSPNNSVLEQSIWALGNIAGDCVEFRDKILSPDVFYQFLLIMESTNNKSILTNTIWVIANLVRKKPIPPLSLNEEQKNIKSCSILIRTILKKCDKKVLNGY